MIGEKRDYTDTKEKTYASLTPNDCTVIGFLAREALFGIERQISSFKRLTNSTSKGIKRQLEEKQAKLQKAVESLERSGFEVRLGEKQPYESALISDDGIQEIDPDQTRQAVVELVASGLILEGEAKTADTEVQSVGLEPRAQEVWAELRKLLEDSKLEEGVTDEQRFHWGRYRGDLERVVEDGLWAQKFGQNKNVLLSEEERKKIPWSDLCEKTNEIIEHVLGGLPR